MICHLTCQSYDRAGADLCCCPASLLATARPPEPEEPSSGPAGAPQCPPPPPLRPTLTEALSSHHRPSSPTALRTGEDWRGLERTPTHRAQDNFVSFVRKCFLVKLKQVTAPHLEIKYFYFRPDLNSVEGREAQQVRVRILQVVNNARNHQISVSKLNTLVTLDGH